MTCNKSKISSPASISHILKLTKLTVIGKIRSIRRLLCCLLYPNVIFCLVKSRNTSSRACRFLLGNSSSSTSLLLELSSSSLSATSSSFVLGIQALICPSVCPEYIPSTWPLHTMDVNLFLVFLSPPFLDLTVAIAGPGIFRRFRSLPSCSSNTSISFSLG